MKLKSIRQVRRLHNRAQYAILKKNFAIILGGDIITSKRSFLVNFVNTVLLFAVVIFIHAVTGTADKGEANMGDFSVESLNEGWTLNNESISLPATIDVSDEKEFTIYNTLPGDIKDGMSMMFTTDHQDIVVSINGEVRESYTTDGFDYMVENLPNTNLVVNLYTKDANGQIAVTFKAKADNYSTINQVNYSYGNNVWFSLITKNIPVVLVGFILTIIGVVAFLVCLLIRNQMMENIQAMIYLSQTLVVAGLWIISESNLRQLLFGIPSLSTIFSYLFIELISVYIILYFDEVQKRRYRKSYLALAAIIIAQVVVNIILQIAGLADLYETLILSHFWTALAAGLGLINIVRDIKKRYIREYFITSIGMLTLIISAVIEMSNFFANKNFLLGLAPSIGFFTMLAMTIVQTIINEIRLRGKINDKQRLIMKNSLEAIASAIDMREEYTSGHSIHVANYTKALAIEARMYYSFTDEDIERFYNIALIHDIGKIVLPDYLFNRPGALTKVELEQVKQHTVVGSYLLGEMKNLADVTQAVRSHHERYDGGGYPDGLEGEDIPLIGRMIAIADSFDAMISPRVYKKRMRVSEAIEEIKDNAGSQFDPILANAFTSLLENNMLNVRDNTDFFMSMKGDIKDNDSERLCVLVEELWHNGEHPELVIDRAGLRLLALLVRVYTDEDKKVRLYFANIMPSPMQASDTKLMEEAFDYLEDVLMRQEHSPRFVIDYTTRSRLLLFIEQAADESFEMLEAVKEEFEKNDRNGMFRLQFVELKSGVEKDGLN